MRDLDGLPNPTRVERWADPLGLTRAGTCRSGKISQHESNRSDHGGVQKEGGDAGHGFLQRGNAGSSRLMSATTIALPPKDSLSRR